MKLAAYLTTTSTKPSHLAAKVSVSASTITRLARGERVPSLDLARKIADATGGAVTALDFDPKAQRTNGEAAA